jgi:hypothetical protein
VTGFTEEGHVNLPPHHSSPYTQLHIGLARVEEQLKNVVTRVEHHMVAEHAEFREALVKVDSIESQLAATDKAMHEKLSGVEKKVDDLYLGAKLTRWVAGGAASVVSFVWWVKDHIHLK